MAWRLMVPVDTSGTPWQRPVQGGWWCPAKDNMTMMYCKDLYSYKLPGSIGKPHRCDVDVPLLWTSLNYWWNHMKYESVWQNCMIFPSFCWIIWILLWCMLILGQVPCQQTRLSFVAVAPKWWPHGVMSPNPDRSDTALATSERRHDIWTHTDIWINMYIYVYMYIYIHMHIIMFLHPPKNRKAL